VTSGSLLVRVTATGPPWASFNTFGQVAVDTVSLYPLVKVDEMVTGADGGFCFGSRPSGQTDLYLTEGPVQDRVPTTP